ncbi:putative GMC oxidoreductase [Hypoxylon fuscum]|nr:putative GMC oxidoreductase [Hypoxylon fuscum]
MASTSFDYVIVGGGLAGLVLAARLSEDAGTDVLVIEAGEDQTSDPRVQIPGMWPTLIRTESAWEFKTVPQQGLEGREIGFPQGRMLGGSSALNGLAFSATSKASIDAWESLGNPGWGWSSFYEAMKKSYTLASEGGEAGGPVQLTVPEADTEWPRVWMETLAALGFSTTGDPFRGELTGGAVVADSVHPLTKQRSYAGNAYLEPARSRPNLTIWTKTEAEKILFDKSDAVVATGVQAMADGETKIARARREVVISAGTIHSPRLLELSGVGDAKLLKSLGIDVVIDNPHVGENLQNHPLCTLSFEVRDEPGFDTIDKLARQDGNAIAAATEAYANQKGPLSRSGANLVAQLPTPGLETEDDRSKLTALLPSRASDSRSEPKSFAQCHESFVRSLLASPTEATGIYIAIPGFAGSTGDGWMAPTPPGPENYFTMTLLLAHPLSRGSVHVARSSTNSSALVIDPKYLAHPLDVEIMARHLQFAEKIAASEPLASHLKLDGKRNPSAPPAGRLADLHVAKDYLRRTAVGSHHFTGTCSMMPRDLGGVVDARLRVHGCQNLRVCDASIIPLTPRTNPQATVYGVAEHAAQMIRAGL